MSTSDLPYLRFTRVNRKRPRIYYDAADAADSPVTYQVDPATFGAFDAGGNYYDRQEFEPAIAAAAVTLGGLPTLVGKTDGCGGSNYLDPKPLVIPPSAPVGSLLLLAVAILDLGRGSEFGMVVLGTNSELWWDYNLRYFPAQTPGYVYFNSDRPWVPRGGWEPVGFDVVDRGFAEIGLGFGIYQKRCEPGDPGSTINPYSDTALIVPVTPSYPEAPFTEHMYGEWLAQLRVYTNATVNGCSLSVSSQAQRNYRPSHVRSNILTPELIDHPGEKQAQFFAAQQFGAYKLKLTAGGSGDLTSAFPMGTLITTIAVPIPDGVGGLTVAPLYDVLSNGPLLAMASEDFDGEARGGVCSVEPRYAPYSGGVGTGAVLNVLIDAPGKQYHANAALERPLDAGGPIQIPFATADLPVQLDLTTPEEAGNFVTTSPYDSPATIFAFGGEIDGAGLMGMPSPHKVGPPGGLGPNVNWEVVAHGPSSLGDFSFPPQVLLGGELAPAATMQILDGALTTADKEQVRTFFSSPPNGDKYEALWTAAGTSLDGDKVRAKVCMMGAPGSDPANPPGLNVGRCEVAALAFNAKDRQNGFAFFFGLLCGWVTDLRLLGTVQVFDPDPHGSGQNFGLLSTFPDNRITRDNGVSEGVYPNVLWVELWRNGNTIQAGIWENDPGAGAQPVLVAERSVAGSDAYGAGVNDGNWGWTADYLDESGQSYTRARMGLDELTLFRPA